MRFIALIGVLFFYNAAVAQTKWVVYEHNSPVYEVLADTLYPVFYNSYRFQTDQSDHLLIKTPSGFIDERYDSISPFQNGLAVVKKNGNFGVINVRNKKIVEPKYKQLYFENKLIRVQDQDGAWGLFDTHGKMIVPPSYDYIGQYSNGLIPVCFSEKWGYINKQGYMFISFQYDSAGSFINDFAIVKSGNKLQLINKENKVRIDSLPGIWTSLPNNTFYHQDTTTGKFTLYFPYLEQNSITGDLLSFSFDSVRGIPGTPFCLITNNHKQGISTNKGEIIIPPLYDAIYMDQRKRFFILHNEEKIYAADQSGITTLSDTAIGGHVLFYSEYFFGIKKGTQYGFVDDQGRIRIATRYDGVRPFDHDKAQVKLQGKWGVVDRAETFVVQPSYDSVGRPLNGLIPVLAADKWGLVNNKDKTIIQHAFDELYAYQNQGWVTRKEEKYGVISLDGKNFANPQFEGAHPLNNELFAYKENGKWGVKNFSLDIVIQPAYSAIYTNQLNHQLILKK